MPKQEMKRIGLDFTKAAKCPECGKTIRANATFCSDCGTSREAVFPLAEGITLRVSKASKAQLEAEFQHVRALAKLHRDTFASDRERRTKEKAELYDALRKLYDDIHKRRPNLSANAKYDLVAKQTFVSKTTVRRAVKDR